MGIFSYCPLRDQLEKPGISEAGSIAGKLHTSQTIRTFSGRRFIFALEMDLMVSSNHVVQSTACLAPGVKKSPDSLILCRKPLTALLLMPNLINPSDAPRVLSDLRAHHSG
ncbi:hypothetical protein BDV24DRAFT_140016 [Aspergillus arachidicola]|uniref:Uncharacterized protein n=1 Tax=Aspergillus arachidicola TaxID=656916 RepID=A0A5N6Y0T2_9EURO|nr:hypothetical protein BDV24DRAFT_140016 [Aspergillus arachidicola]